MTLLKSEPALNLWYSMYSLPQVKGIRPGKILKSLDSKIWQFFTPLKCGEELNVISESEIFLGKKKKKNVKASILSS